MSLPWADELGLDRDSTASLSLSQCTALQGALRTVYCRQVYLQTGRWIIDGADHHTFAQGHAQCTTGHAALADIGAHAPCEVLLVTAAGAPRVAGWRGRLTRAPVRDVANLWLAPMSFDWCALFTDGELGPFYSRREWVAGGSDDLPGGGTGPDDLA